MADGDESALAALYDGWAERVHTLASWILKDPDEAEDVVEDTFWQAWRTASRFDARRGAGSTWLMMIARSRALDRLRARRRWADWTAIPGNTGVLLENTAAVSAEMPDAHSERTSARRRWPQPSTVSLPSSAGWSKWHSSAGCRTPRSRNKWLSRSAR